MIRILLLCLLLMVPGRAWAGITMNGVINDGAGVCSYNISFGILSDNHYNETENTNVQNVTEIVNFWNNQTVDFIVSLGDMVDDDGANKTHELLNLANLEVELLKFDGDVYGVLGNHDLEVLNYTDYFDSSSIIKSNYTSFNRSGYHLVFLRGADSTPYFNMSQTQLDWLTNDLANSSLPTIVFIHQGIEWDFPGNLSAISEEGDGSNQLATWSFEGLALSNTNIFRLYWNLTNSGTTRTIDLYKNSTKDSDSKIASGNRNGDGIISFTAVASSNLTGNVTVAYSGDDTSGGNNITIGDFAPYPFNLYAYNANTTREILEADSDVFVVFRGHGHSNKFDVINNITHIEVPACSSGANFQTIYIYNRTVSVNGNGTAESY